MASTRIPRIPEKEVRHAVRISRSEVMRPVRPAPTTGPIETDHGRDDHDALTCTGLVASAAGVISLDGSAAAMLSASRTWCFRTGGCQ